MPNEQDDIKDLAKNLVMSEPLMVLGKGAAAAGQMASDAKDAVVSKVQEAYDKFRPMLPGQTAPTRGDIALPSKARKKK